MDIVILGNSVEDTKARETHEEAFLASFVEKSRAARFMELRKTKNGRGKFLEEFAGWNFLKPDLAIAAPPNFSHQAIVAALQRLKVPEVCYVASAWKYPCGAFVPLEYAFEESQNDGGMLISCFIGELICCVGEYGVPQFIASRNPVTVRNLLYARR